jgi:hypothetical protein
MIGFFLVLLLATTILLTVSILNHSEAGLIEGVPQWNRSQFPLQVSALSYRADDASVLDTDHRDVVDHVIETVNTRLGFDAFAWADGDPADVVVVVGVPLVVGADLPEQGFAPDGGLFNAGEFSQIQHRDGRAEVCELRTSNTGTTDLLSYALYHGFGHCLGLDHDDYTQSIMYPDAQVYEGLPPWISDHDKELLRGLYAPERGSGSG